MRFATRLLSVLSVVGLALSVGGCGSSTTPPPPPPVTYTISGTVSGVTAAGVTVALGGAASLSTTTASDGTYSFAGLANGTYTVTPSKAGYTFTPASRSVTVASANQTAQNFTAALTTYTVSGNISGASSVLVNLGQGASVQGTSTDVSGNFSFTVTNGTYTLEPVLTGYTFSPLSRVVVVNGANVPGNTFTATAVTTPVWSVNVQLSGAVLQGVTLTLTQLGTTLGTAASSDSGFHAFAGLADGTYEVTPTLAGYTFAPASRSVTVAAADPATLAFVATAITYTISGTVNGADGVTVALGGAASASTTSVGGTYSFTGLANGSYTVTPAKTGYTFAPASRSVVVNLAEPAAQDFTASLAAIYSISGTVSGTVLSGVTMTLSGTASAVQTTGVSATYSFTGLTLGSYTVTPSSSGSAFAPASRTISITGTSLAAQNFTSSDAPTYTLSGTVTGPWVQGVTVTLSGASTATATTGANGAYTIAGVPDGTVTVTPSLAGYTFDPPAPSVTMASAAKTQNFTATSAIPSYSISGTVSGGAGATGRVYVSVYSSGCSSNCSPQAKTSIAGPGAYTIRGLQNGTYSVWARRDSVGQGVANASDPTGTTASSVTISSANSTGADITLTDPTTPTPGTISAAPTVIGGSGGVLVFWNTDKDGNGREKATSYDVSFGTAVDATGTVVNVMARDDGVYFKSGLVTGTPYYFKVRSKVGGTNGGYSSIGSGIVGPATGGFTVSGTVSFTGTATGPLYVAVGDPQSGSMQVSAYASPGSSPVTFSVSGVPAGTWNVYAILDQNANGVIDAGDLSNTGGGDSPMVAVSADTSGVSVALSSAKGIAYTGTIHSLNEAGTIHDYAVQTNVTANVRRVVKAAVVAGKNIAVPADLGGDRELYLWNSLGTTAPLVGDTYTYEVTYDDGSAPEILTAPVTAVLSSFARNLTATTTSPGSPGQPYFTWTAPASPPTPYYGYNVSVWGNGAGWYWPRDAWMVPSTITAVRYNVDGFATPATLTTGLSYTWSVTVLDAARNRARQEKIYIP
jgi:uncharacterized protein (DUF2141 family)